MLRYKNLQFFTLILTMALFLSACAFQADPSLLQVDTSTQAIDSSANASVAEISAEMPYETQFVEINGSQMAYVEAGEVLVSEKNLISKQQLFVNHEFNKEKNHDNRKHK